MAHSSNGPPRKQNRLATQSSPYLLQHAFNPVDWWPWGEEAFTEARRRDVPILLSVGYSTCYWCHVMERECFEDEVIGRLMSERFVCIKLDREERPDVDEIYMTALQMLAGRAGWPMNMFLDPVSLRPFWGGTYFPPEPHPGMAAWPAVLEAMSRAWRERREDAMKQGEAVGAAVREHLGSGRDAAAVGEAQVTDALSRVLRMFDRAEGGFGSAPKFPQPSFIEFLLDVRDSAGDDATRDAVDEAVRRTLNRMMCGGIFDHVGGGFHRYSVDATWTVPHFEKMLYDNAQLAHVYARAARAYSDGEFARAARCTAEYVLREMTHESGAFFSAQDAEVDGREGLNYLWTEAEVRAALAPEDADLAVRVYGLDRGPNFRDPHHPEAPPSSVLRMSDRLDRVAASMSMPAPALAARLERINAALLAARARREQPRLDDKVLASWNGLMIGALARCAAALDEPRFFHAAERAADAVLERLSNQDGTLRRSWRAGVPGPEGVLEDYAYMIAGLIALARGGRDSGNVENGGRRFLDHAERLAESAARDFREPSGAWFDTTAGRPDLFVRTSSTSDGALPSASSVMLHNLLDLFALTGKESHRDHAAGLLASLSGAIAASPVGTINATRALFRVLTDEHLRGLAPAGAPAAVAAEPDPGEPFLPVEIYSDAERISVTPEKPAVVRLVLRIAPGYHIIAADPGVEGQESPDGLSALRIGVHGGTGLRVFAEYPRGTAHGPDGSGIMIHEGEIEFRAILEREGAWRGRPMLTVTYQACTETECLAARTVELDVAIDAG